MKTRHLIILNGPAPTGKPWFTVRNADGPGPAEILIYEQIGKDYWTDDGVSAKEFAAALKAIPSDRQILVRINSPGGNVWDGMAIYNMLQARKEFVTCKVDGIAASIASVIAMGGKTCEMPKNAMLMIHEPSTLVAGDSEDMRKMADLLDKHADIIAQVYADKTGKPPGTFRALMKSETWLDGEESQKLGLCDTVSTDTTITNTFDLSAFRKVPAAITNKINPDEKLGAKSKNNNMRIKLIALLNKHGISFLADATDEQLLALCEGIATAPAANSHTADITALQASLAAITARHDTERNTRITARVTELAPNRIPAGQIENWIRRAITDETVLTDLAALPVVPPGASPVSASVELIAENGADVAKWVGENGTSPLVASMLRGNQVNPEDLRNASIATATAIIKHRDRLTPILNTNTMDTSLKRQVIMGDMIRAFKRRVLPINALSSLYNNVPLQGTDEVVVPYYPLDTQASTDFVQANGYVFDKNTNTSMKKVTINKRKYQPFDFSSAEFRRLPYFNVAQLAALKAEQLGVDVSNDIFSIVVRSTYTQTPVILPAAAFNYDSVVDLSVAANLIPWPEGGRSLIIDSSYDGNLRKDPAVRSALNYGSNEPVQKGTIPVLSGFSLYQTPSVPTNGENLKGFAIFKSAILAATSPVMPAPGVLKLLVSYDLVTDPDTGVTIEYRYWGEPQKDGDREVIECNYGYAAGEPTALLIIASQ